MTQEPISVSKAILFLRTRPDRMDHDTREAIATLIEQLAAPLTVADDVIKAAAWKHFEPMLKTGCMNWGDDVQDAYEAGARFAIGLRTGGEASLALVRVEQLCAAADQAFDEDDDEIDVAGPLHAMVTTADVRAAINGGRPTS